MRATSAESRRRWRSRRPSAFPRASRARLGFRLTFEARSASTTMRSSIPLNTWRALPKPFQGKAATFEQSRVVDWDPRHVVTDDGSIAAKAVVMATHLPLGQVGGFYAVAHPRAEPMVVAPIGRVPDG